MNSVFFTDLDAVVRHRVALLIVIGKRPYAELATTFVSTLPKILTFLDRHTPPFIAKVNRPSPAELAKRPNAAGTVNLWYPT